jgi:TPR repeat protein
LRYAFGMVRSLALSLAIGAIGAALASAGCAQLGDPAGGALPRDVHAAPEAHEVAEHPCRYGDVTRCVAKCGPDDPQACNAAGVMFEFDDGTASDPSRALGFYSQACEGNYAQGCNNLAWLYLRGHGVPRDPPHAMLLFMAAFDAARIACTRGDPSGCLLAGEMLYEGRGVPEDEAQAVAFFQQACAGGEAAACRQVDAY